MLALSNKKVNGHRSTTIYTYSIKNVNNNWSKPGNIFLFTVDVHWTQHIISVEMPSYLVRRAWPLDRFHNYLLKPQTLVFQSFEIGKVIFSLSHSIIFRQCVHGMLLSYLTSKILSFLYFLNWNGQSNSQKADIILLTILSASTNLKMNRIGYPLYWIFIQNILFSHWDFSWLLRNFFCSNLQEIYNSDLYKWRSRLWMGWGRSSSQADPDPCSTGNSSSEPCTAS